MLEGKKWKLPRKFFPRFFIFWLKIENYLLFSGIFGGKGFQIQEKCGFDDTFLFCFANMFLSDGEINGLLKDLRSFLAFLWGGFELK